MFLALVSLFSDLSLVVLVLPHKPDFSLTDGASFAKVLVIGVFSDHRKVARKFGKLFTAFFFSDNNE